VAKTNTDRAFMQDMNDKPVSYTCLSSGLLSSSQAVFASKTVLVSLIVYTNGSSNATATLYDNASAASGTEVAKIIVKGADLIGGEAHIMCDCENGLYLALSGTGAGALVRYI